MYYRRHRSVHLGYRGRNRVGHLHSGWGDVLFLPPRDHQVLGASVIERSGGGQAFLTLAAAMRSSARIVADPGAERARKAG